MLQTRIVDRDSSDYPKDALHLFAESLFMTNIMPKFEPNARRNS